MAINKITPGAGPANAFSRRGIIGALAAAPVVASSVAVRANAGAAKKGTEIMNMHTTIAPTCNRTTRAAWDRILAAREAAKRAHENYDASVCRPLDDELNRIAPRPDLWFEVTAKNGQTARFNVWPAKLHEWDDHVSPVFREKAAAVREAWLAHLAARERLGWDTATDESERLCSTQCDRERDLILMPAPDLAALLWKLDHLFGEGAGRSEEVSGDAYCAEWINALMADARRLLGR